MIKHITTLILIIFSYISFCFPDYLSRDTIAPGVVYHHDYCSSEPWHIQVIEIDLSNQAITLETVKAESSLFARQKTTVMSRKLNGENHFTAAAINADFFEWDGTPVGAQVTNGVLINEPTFRSVFGMTEHKQPFISIINWKGQLFIKKNIVYEINGLNRKVKKNELILFNSYYHADTLSYSGGTIIRAVLFSDEFTLNDTMEFQISKIVKSDNLIINSTDIKENEIVLIGPNDNFSDLKLGDKIQILQKIFPITDRVDQLIGGLPRLIRDGILSIDWQKEKVRETFSTQRHPRTAVGYTKDKKKVLLFVVDGRQPGYSVGMTLPELADYMLEWGIYQGVNLDGGGSSTMVVHGELVNKPSDANGERPVANALMVVNVEPYSTVMKLDIIPDEVVLSPGTELSFEIHLQDINFHPANMPSDSVHWYCDPNLGFVDSTGLFKAGALTITSYLYVQEGTMIDSAKVSIIDEN